MNRGTKKDENNTIDRFGFNNNYAETEMGEWFNFIWNKKMVLMKSKLIYGSGVKETKENDSTMKCKRERKKATNRGILRTKKVFLWEFFAALVEYTGAEKEAL